MSTYFGNNITTVQDAGGGPWTVWRKYTSPDLGNLNILNLQLSCYDIGTTTLRLAIYNSDGSQLICQGTGAIAVGAAQAWQGHAAANLSATSLSGNTDYILAWTYNATGNMGWAGDSPGTGDRSVQTDYTGGDGFPSSLPSPDYDFYGYRTAIRCEVEAAGGGGSVLTVVRNRFSRRMENNSLFQSFRKKMIRRRSSEH